VGAGVKVHHLHLPVVAVRVAVVHPVDHLRQAVAAVVVVGPVGIVTLRRINSKITIMIQSISLYLGGQSCEICEFSLKI